jgi:hypothetical protein
MFSHRSNSTVISFFVLDLDAKPWFARPLIINWGPSAIDLEHGGYS